MQLIDNYSSCTQSEAQAAPRETCIGILNQPTFDMFSSAEKAQVCQVAVGSYNALKNAADATGSAKPDACATLQAHLFQSYSDHLQELSDTIITSLTEGLTEKLHKASADFEEQKKTTKVQMALKEANGDKII